MKVNSNSKANFQWGRTQTMLTRQGEMSKVCIFTHTALFLQICFTANIKYLSINKVTQKTKKYVAFEKAFNAIGCVIY
jgi:hypothetical protein